MVYNGSEVLDADNDVDVLFVSFEALKLVPLHSDGCVKRFLQYLLGLVVSVL